MPLKDHDERNRYQAKWAREHYECTPEGRDTRTRFSHKLQVTIHEAKRDRGCAHCGYNANPAALEFDHIIPRRVTGEPPTRVMNSYIRLESALTDPNVQVLCANCHAIKSVGERKRIYSLESA